MEITTAVQGRETCDRLKKELLRLRYNPDLKKMLANIEIMVTELSKIEVTCRQAKSNARLIDPLNKLNASVRHLEQFILIATLMD